MRRAVEREGRLPGLSAPDGPRRISRRNQAACLVSFRRLRGRATRRRLLLGTRSRRHGRDLLAMDKVLRRRVALKVIDVPEAARGLQSMRERFLREARAAAALRHPNVAAIFQFGASPDATYCYYAMELVEGETLAARVRRDGPLKVELALEIAIQTTRALMAAAAQNLIHRDLKPGNIMLTAGNAATTELEVKVIDFGLAKAIADAGGEMDLTHGGFVGTPSFASPEQFGTGPVDARSDIYSLGATLWFALTGLP